MIKTDISLKFPVCIFVTLIALTLPKLAFAEINATPLSEQSLGKMRYTHTLKEIMKKHAIYPRESKRRSEQGTVECLIIINRNGKVSDFEYIKKSQHARLNLSAKHAVHKATFPEIPKNLPSDTFEFRVALKFSL